jgi:hypothetical protein
MTDIVMVSNGSLSMCLCEFSKNYNTSHIITVVKYKYFVTYYIYYEKIPQIQTVYLYMYYNTGVSMCNESTIYHI